MTITIDFFAATSIVIAIAVGFIVSFRRPSRDVVPQNKGGGCLMLVLIALAVLVGLANGITNNATARTYSEFYISVALVLILLFLQRSGVDVYGGVKQVCRASPSSDFRVAWLVSAVGFLGIAILACACLCPYVALLMGVCNVPSYTVGIPYVPMVVFDSTKPRLDVLHSSVVLFSVCAGLVCTLRQRSKGIAGPGEAPL